ATRSIVRRKSRRAHRAIRPRDPRGKSTTTCHSDSYALMGKKPQRHSWPEAKKLCRLNQNDIEMAKRLGFGPDALVRARPDPKQKWKLPVNDWVRELYFKRYGEVLGEKRIVPPQFT